MKVLITGGAGFIGSHVAEELVALNYNVVIIDNLATSSTNYLPNGIRFYQMDIQDPSVESIFKNEKPDIVIHLAAQTSVINSMKDPYFDFQSNTAATVKILDYSSNVGVKQFLFASTAAVYGDSKKLPLQESDVLDPQSFYAVSKYAAEKYIQTYAKLHNFTSTILRFANVYGPRQNNSGEAGVVDIFVSTILSENDCVIYGGNQTRDFIYVKDVAVACRKAVEKNKSGIFNVSSNIELAIGDLNDTMMKKMLSRGKTVYKPYRTGELLRSVLSNEKTKKELGWLPLYTISKGLDETIAHSIQIKSKNIAVKN
ncbi:NAD-dependent epimerase/dehydratase family protein [Sporosarcina oncorhynchi]|uniref:NAD-dependent epimerase/dehydratase family protein n=1 Tax=Sporosarcina oncorhynchi TaxID=3056444 RepID=A0ABZ0L2R7_9BACL|nr:NAD-dependent epimerase/dehydratase family protein [Sporosarcina sp. T2O-4]WOV86477.1 NAD-dependent epimerase/dehydratase family protein [Sporosarcina sp. T2O-4]